MTLTGFVFPKLRTLKRWINKCLKSPVSEQPSTSNMVNVSKHCWNLHHSTFIILICHWQGICNRKSFSYWHTKSWVCLLTYWLPMKIFLFLIEKIWRYQFTCNYLKNKNLFRNFLLHFWNRDWISTILKKNMTLTAFVFPKLRILKTWTDKCLKSPVLEDPSTSNMVNVPKRYWNLHHSTIIILIGHWERNCNWKSLSYWQAKSWDCLLTHWLPMETILLLIETI